MKKLAFLALIGVPASTIWLSASGFDSIEVMIYCIGAGFLATALGLFMILHAADHRQRPWPLLAATLASTGIIVSVLMMHWPLRLAFAISRPDLDALASDVRFGHIPAQPRWVGLFKIVATEVLDDGAVCLWTRDHACGCDGFVEIRSGDIPFSVWSQVTLDKRWQFISQD
jgi:hypothetical protein